MDLLETTQTMQIDLTPSAADAVQELLAKLVSEQHGVKLVIDEISINYLSGATVDYVDEVMGSGFKIENPNAVSTCGCGSSFETSDDPTASGAAGGCSC
jgi:iron-sulfur cluster assembly protein